MIGVVRLHDDPDSTGAEFADASGDPSEMTSRTTLARFA
jgi:hypothetical protein